MFGLLDLVLLVGKRAVLGKVEFSLLLNFVHNTSENLSLIGNRLLFECLQIIFITLVEVDLREPFINAVVQGETCRDRLEDS